jgi:chromate reductase
VVKVLAVSGSLRRGSSNTALVEAATRLARPIADVAFYRELADLPPFVPDFDPEPPAIVTRWRQLLQECDAVLISSPEYAHGVPGVLKNALDWIVGSGELVDKPIALFNASPRATYAWASLVETLTVMSARVVRDASITIPVQGLGLDAEAITRNPVLSGAIASALAVLADAARTTTAP